jgi:hypothetical protein
VSLTVALLTWLVGQVFAAGEKPVSPYIDSLRSQMPAKESSEGSYTERAKQKLQKPDATESYTEQLKKQLPPAQGDSEGYSDKKRSTLPPKNSDSAIQAVREGRSELKMKRLGKVTNAVGFRIGAGMSYNVASNSEYQLRSFSDVYGSRYAPDFAFTYEWQPFRSEILGNIGLVGSVGLGFFRGVGQFAIDLGADFQSPRTKFFFWSVPVSIGANYRFNLFKYVKPYVFAGPTLIGFLESRDDDEPTLRGYSTALNTSLGVSVLLDWMNSESAWNYYDDFQIKHTYLTIEYQRLTPLTGVVSFASSGIFAGFLFEY